ncbi:MAG: prepilin-type N-terminal cleavage/methylation domain-containing protein [Gammaproteobacteria bacterium]|nr:prepilin-type N-terminal cleavage/methylation domain-containing protein [Gammaproteobacteria bacterium]
MQQVTKGFTLIEIAIVLVIVGLLLGGLLMPLATQVEVQRRIETEKTLEQIKEALIGFAMVNGRLPCPANPSAPTGTPTAGVERITAAPPAPACGAAGEYGVVPWVTLGVSELDAWGRRFTYRVTPSFPDAIVAGTIAPTLPPGCAIPTNSSFALCSIGDMLITNGPALGNATVAQAIPAAIVSHGKNGNGAYLPTGIQMPCPALPPPFPPPPPPPSEEIQNGICPPGDTATTFISHPPTAATAPGGEFDDIVTWIVPSTLMGRMVAAGRLP